MILCDDTIKNYIINKNLMRDVDYSQIQPASVDIRLGTSFKYIKDKNKINSINKNDFKYDEVASTENGVLLGPKEFCLATTKEYIDLPDNLTAFIEGRSSIGRLGLFIQNAGWIDPGFHGEITLELFNATNNYIRLIPGTRIGQIIFMKLDKPCCQKYNGKYNGQKGATISRIYLDEDN